MNILAVLVGCFVIPFIGGVIASRKEDSANYPLFERTTENN